MQSPHIASNLEFEFEIYKKTQGLLPLMLIAIFAKAQESILEGVRV